MLKDILLSLRMYGALEALETGIFSRIEGKEEYTLEILKAEFRYRERKQAARRLKAAVFPSDKDWEEIDKKLNPEIDFDAVKALSNGSNSRYLFFPRGILLPEYIFSRSSRC